MPLYSYDKDILKAENIAVLCGVDEAGRGPLAGPVYVAAVVLDYDNPIAGINDSKKLSEKKRDLLYDEIIAKAVAYSIVSVSAADIDDMNILEATLHGMREAVKNLDISPSLALIDGNTDPKLDINTKLVVSGDATSAAIAAASILAKVSRDRHMLELDKQYPMYDFKKHKGYGTKAHMAALDEHGACEVHRESFLKKWRAKNERS